MINNKIGKKELSLILIFGIIFSVGTILIFSIPTSIKSSYSQVVQTIDGVNIYFNVFEPKEALYQAKNGDAKKPAIIIAHGATLNKEDLKGYALEIAASGFIAIPFDFRGLGQSTGNQEEGSLLDDIRAIISYLETRDDVDMNNLGYIGYSMGGVGFQLVKENTAFKCFIGVGTGLPTILEDTITANSGRKLNLLMIQARYDEAFSLSSVKEGMAIRLGIPSDQVDVNKLYGCFDEGTASMIYLDDDSNHLKVGWDTNFIRVARDWIINTFPQIRTVDENFYANVRLVILAIQLIGGMGIFFSSIGPLSKLILKPKEEDLKQLELNDESLLSLMIKTILISVLLGLPGIILFMPIFLLLPLATAGFIIMLLFGQWLGIFILLWHYRKKINLSFSQILKTPLKEEKRVILREIVLGFVLGVLLYIIAYLSIGLNYLGILPSYTKFLYIPLYFILLFIIILVPGILYYLIIPTKFEKNLTGSLKTASLAFILQFSYIFIYLLGLSVLINNYYYFGSYIPIAIPLFLLISFTSIISYKKTGNIIVGTIISALFFTLFLLTLSTPTSGFAFLSQFIS